MPAQRNSPLAAYSDPVRYDLESAAFDPAGTILLDLASAVSGRVLELGCGTGRVTIPLAAAGVAMTGLDIAPGLIERAQAKAGTRPIEWICADVCSFQLPAQFDLIFSYGLVFQHLLAQDEQISMLARVREHLAPGGRFLIDVGFKRPSAMVSTTTEEEWYTYTDAEGRAFTVTGTDQYDHVRQIWTQTMYRYRQSGRNAPTRDRTELTLRYFMPQEMETILTCNGFSIVARYGDWKGNPLTEQSHLQIYVCGRAE